MPHTPATMKTTFANLMVVRLSVDEAASLVVAELGNSGREPDTACVANQQHRARADEWGRTQRVVDPKIAVRLERNTGDGRAVLHERRGGLTNQRREDTLVGVLPDRVAAGEEQSAPFDPDMAVQSSA